MLSNVDKVYFDGLKSNLPNLDKKASEAIKSFAALVDELNKFNKLGTGTPVKEEVKHLTGELNNSSVFFARMIGDELNKLHGIVNPVSTSETEVESKS